MNANEYADLRRKVGSQADLARLLGITTRTIQRRERPGAKISSEASIAIRQLVKSLIMFPTEKL